MADALNDILNNPEKMSQIMSLAQTFMGNQNNAQSSEQNSGNANEDAAKGNEQDSSFEPPSFSQSNTFGSNGSSQSTQNFDFTADLMSKAIPTITRITSSAQNGLSKDKINLLNSVAPFVSDDVSVEFSHAMKLVSMAKVVKAAFNEFKPGDNKSV